MSETNLFCRLAGYSLNPRKRSLENFTTELLAHLFNDDVVFRRRFLNLIMDDKRMARPFQRARAYTQEFLGKDCRVDLVLRAGSKKHLVEVKVAAGETLSGRWGQTGKPQILRYLDLKCGHVTYLTTRESLAPITDHRGRKYKMVKHALFEDLYQSLRAATVRPLVETFLNFMKANDMSGPEPFNHAELKRADQSMRVVRKCLSTLAIVRTEVNSQLRQNLKTRSNLTRPTYFNGGDDGDEVWCYLPKFRRKAVKWVGLSIRPEHRKLYFDIWMWGTLDRSIAKMRDSLSWKEYDGAHGCYSSIQLNGTHNDIPRMVKHAAAASRSLGRAIRKFAK